MEFYSGETRQSGRFNDGFLLRRSQFGSLAAVASLMSNDWALLAGWVHYLAFDLFIGAVMARRMDQVGISRVVQAPILGATFMLGPIGFLIAGLTELGLRKAGLLTQRVFAEGSLHVRL